MKSEKRKQKRKQTQGRFTPTDWSWVIVTGNKPLPMSWKAMESHDMA